jgi:hypothetical protein
MLRLCSAILATALIASALPASAAPAPTFSTSFVQAAVPRGAAGRDAGVDVSQGNYVRISASGAFSVRSGICGRRALSNWMPVGTYASLPVPAGAKRLLLRAYGMGGHEYGAYRVVTDVVPNANPAQLGSGSSTSTAAIHIGPNNGSGSVQSLGVRIASPGTQIASTGTDLRPASSPPVPRSHAATCSTHFAASASPIRRRT